MKYFFILGHSPEISRAEIKAVLLDKYQEFIFSHQALILEINDLDAKKLIQKLGGTIKIGMVLKEIPFQNATVALDDIYGTLSSLDFFHITEKRINFGFSLYPLDSSIPNELAKSFLKIGIRLKKDLKEKGYSSRFITSREKTLSSVIVGENKLIERGADICLLFFKEKIYLGKTLAIQDYKQFSRQDYGRPERDAKSGMLPPKLARMMINLSQIKPDETLLDPFCGSGTILQEALLLGIKKVIGSDISPKAIDDTNRNLNWLTSPPKADAPLAQNFLLPTSNFSILNSDIKNLPNKLKEQVDTVVTEPYLGPPLRGNESLSKIKGIVQTLSNLYLESFRVFNRILRRGGRLVIVFPLLKNNGREIDLPILPEIEKLGFSIKKDLSDAQRGSLIYSRPDQKVLREIFVFRRS